MMGWSSAALCQGTYWNDVDVNRGTVNVMLAAQDPKPTEIPGKESLQGTW